MPGQAKTISEVFNQLLENIRRAANPVQFERAWKPMEGLIEDIQRQAEPLKDETARGIDGKLLKATSIKIKAILGEEKAEPKIEALKKCAEPRKFNFRNSDTAWDVIAGGSGKKPKGFYTNLVEARTTRDFGSWGKKRFREGR